MGTLKRNILEYFYGEKKVDLVSAIASYIKDIGPSQEATFWKLYLKSALDEKYHDRLRGLFNSLHDFVKKNVVDYGFEIEARGKSFKSTLEKKMKVQSEKKSLDTIKDFVGFRIVIYSGKSEIEQIYDAHRLAKICVDFFEGQGYIPCKADDVKETDGFETKCSIDIPEKEKVEEILGDYYGFFKNYNLTPKANGYQAIHVIFKDDEGRYIELQIRTLEQDARAENDSCEEEKSVNVDVEDEYLDAGHDEYKKKYKKIFIDYDRVNLIGFIKTGKKIKDVVGFTKALLIYHRTRKK